MNSHLHILNRVSANHESDDGGRPPIIPPSANRCPFTLPGRNSKSESTHFRLFPSYILFFLRMDASWHENGWDETAPTPNPLFELEPTHATPSPDIPAVITTLQARLLSNPLADAPHPCTLPTTTSPFPFPRRPMCSA